MAPRDLVEQLGSASGSGEDSGCTNIGETRRPQVSAGLQEEQHADADTDDNVDKEEDGEDPLESFRPVLSHLRLERLSELAISLKTALVGDVESGNLMTCTINPQPLAGSYNILYRVTFSDSSAWVFKIPGTGYSPEWSEASGRWLRSEAKTMNLIRKRTSIPVPEVFAFDSGLHNIINAPYIAMEFVDGIQMAERWFSTADGSEQLSDDLLEERRLKWLKTLAEYSYQLGQFTFDKCGMLEFKDDEDWPTSIGPSVCDLEAEAPKFREIGPFSDTKSYLLQLLDVRTSGRPSFDLERILRYFINSIPDSIANAELNGHRFVLTHPDFGFQNIIISNDSDCRILSIIDWDGVETSPLCLGNEAYPHFITRDWDPLMYHYDPKNPASKKRENSPEQLQHYREIFATSMQSLVGPERECFTRYSHIYEALAIAAGDKFCYAEIIFMLIEKCLEASAQNESQKKGGGMQEAEEQEELMVYDVIEAFAEDPPEPSAIERLRKGFLRICGQGHVMKGLKILTLTQKSIKIAFPFSPPLQRLSHLDRRRKEFRRMTN
ncbi:kinase-like domain-containing protein [Tirmania nivea]|nr:kinase-like domain-containing protein [Tirmania nivea]